VITHPEKVLFPDDGITKGELCAYYEALAPVMLPHLRGRPITMERFPAGIGKPGFIQKDVSRGFPAWLERVPVETKGVGSKPGRTVHYPLAADARSLVWLANQNSITPHVWTSRLPDLDRADLCVFDLDPPADDSREVRNPSEGSELDDGRPLRRAALAVRGLLDELGLPTFVKTSGSKGFHIVVPVDGEAGFEPVWRFAHGAGAVLVKRHPDLFTQEFIKADRGGRIFVDTGRNGQGATFAAAYAVRPKPGAPVSAPCSWREVEDGVGPRTFKLGGMAERIAAVGDLWRDLERERRPLDGAIAAVERILTDDDWKEALAASTRRPTSRKRAPTRKR
jgi:bifunctional non-homologous end joining protein LigD